jgi:hypothetical protein
VRALLVLPPETEGARRGIADRRRARVRRLHPAASLRGLATDCWIAAAYDGLDAEDRETFKAILELPAAMPDFL